MRYNSLPKLILVLQFFLIVFNSNAQKFGDKKFYVVDSLNLELLTPDDVTLINKTLKQYHSEKSDTTRIKLLASIAEQSWNLEVWPKYNLFVKIEVERLLLVEKLTAKKYLYTKLRAQAINNIGFYYNSHGDIPKALNQYFICLNIQKTLKDSAGMGNTYNNIGGAYMYISLLDSSLLYYNLSVKLNSKLNNKEFLVHPLLNIAYLYNLKGDVLSALDYYKKSLILADETNNYQGMTSSLLNLWEIYKAQKDPILALKYLDKALKVSEKIGYKEGMAAAISNSGAVYQDLNEFEKALILFRKASKIFLEIEDKQGYASTLSNIGTIYKNANSLDSALYFYKSAQKIYLEIEYKEGEVAAVREIADIHFKKGKIKEAKIYAEKSLKMAKELGYPKQTYHIAQLLNKIYDKENNPAKAYEMYKLYILMRDSINNIDTKKAYLKQNMEYEYTTKKITDSLQYAEKQRIVKLEYNQKIQRKNYLIYGAATGIFLLILLSVFIFKSYNDKKKANDIISLKNEELNQTNEEISAQRDQIEHQREVIEHTHNEVKASIRYAERIQKALLSTDDSWERIGSDRFILFKPRDVVSGDFYWAYANEEVSIWAAADCTGHGVPGAFMSMLGIGLLNEIVAEGGEIVPGNILNILRSKIIKSLEQKSSDDQRKDGMDIALCMLNKSTNMLYFSGANNPLIIVRSIVRHSALDAESHSNWETLKQVQGDDFVLFEIKGDKMPIGKHILDDRPFTTHEVQLQKTDTIYTFTDGYQDQFGGPEGKKYMVKRLKQYLIGLNDFHPNRQKEMLNDEFEQWIKTGNSEQIDDVCLVGVKI